MKKTVLILILAALASSLAGCGFVRSDESAAPAAQGEQAAPAETAEPQINAAGSGRLDGERFEDIIFLEGMEERVSYEHIINTALGLEMDYDYENFVRRSEADREMFISDWDDPDKPENYLEIRRDTGDAELVAEAVIARLSADYDILRSTLELDHAGSCIYLEASVIKGSNQMAEHIQSVYIIPAPDGCRIAVIHSFITESEGFFRRFGYMLNTLIPLEAQ